MTRLLLLLAAVLTLNACEKHDAKDLPEEFQDDKKHGAKSEAVSDRGVSLAAVTRSAPR